MLNIFLKLMVLWRHWMIHKILCWLKQIGYVNMECYLKFLGNTYTNLIVQISCTYALFSISNWLSFSIRQKCKFYYVYLLQSKFQKLSHHYSIARRFDLHRCLIELFVALFVLSLCPFDISVGVGAFVIGLSQISSFFSYRIFYGKMFIRQKSSICLIKI